MSKRKRYYYECVHEVELHFMGPDHRRERWTGLTPPTVRHPIRFNPHEPLSNRPADVLMSDRPLAKHLLEPIKKKVRRKNLRTGEYEMKETETRVKFELLDPEDVTDDVRRRAKELQMPEDCYAESREELAITEVM